VRRGDHVVVYLSGRPFHRLVVDVGDDVGDDLGDAHRTHRRIEAALLRSKQTALRQSLRHLLHEPDSAS
jgi:hypothetical protein